MHITVEIRAASRIAALPIVQHLQIKTGKVWLGLMGSPVEAAATLATLEPAFQDHPDVAALRRSGSA